MASISPLAAGSTSAAVERLAALAAANLLADPVLSESGGSWVHKFAREMSELAAAFIVTPPQQAVLSATDWTLWLPGNPQRYGLLIWRDGTEAYEISPVSQPANGGHGLQFLNVNDVEYYDYRKHGLLVGQQWFGISASGLPATLQWVEIRMN